VGRLVSGSGLFVTKRFPARVASARLRLLGASSSRVRYDPRAFGETFLSWFSFQYAVVDETINFSEDASRAEQLLQKRSVRLGLIWGVWTIVALFFTGQVYMMYYTEKRIGFGKVFFMQASACYLWAFATPLVLWLARRFRIDRNNWRSRVILHTMVSLALSAFLISLHFVIYMAFVGRASELTALRTFQYVFYNLDRWLLTYWLIVLMSHAFNYYNSYRKGELKSSQLKTQLVQSQLEALKMQVHPHFLFNTLHSISALLNKDTEAARRMITRLGDFLRMTLENAGTQEVTLQQEMEFLNGYLEIERIRFQDRLITLVEVDPEVLDVRVPNLILQPIVENAMRHAINRDCNCRHVEILAARRNGLLRIQVKDNGPGLCADQDFVSHRGKRVGLTNTKARLERLYGTKHRFELTNNPAGGLVVTMEIPATSSSLGLYSQPELANQRKPAFIS
jgi:two-component system, LytTR family, sensor kinase